MDVHKTRPTAQPLQELREVKPFSRATQHARCSPDCYLLDGMASLGIELVRHVIHLLADLHSTGAFIDNGCCAVPTS
jgi:hypothetical protein